MNTHHSPAWGMGTSLEPWPGLCQGAAIPDNCWALYPRVVNAVLIQALIFSTVTPGPVEVAEWSPFPDWTHPVIELVSCVIAGVGLRGGLAGTSFLVTLGLTVVSGSLPVEMGRQYPETGGDLAVRLSPTADEAACD